MEVKEVSITAINFKNLKPEDVFKWLEMFSFNRYGERHFIDPKKGDDPRYPSERDGSPPDWYTFLQVTSNCYDRDMIIIDEETYEKIKKAFLASLPKEME